MFVNRRKNGNTLGINKGLVKLVTEIYTMIYYVVIKKTKLRIQTEICRYLNNIFNEKVNCKTVHLV